MIGGVGIESGGKRGCYLVAETFGSDDGNFIADTFVGFEVEGEFRVVTFDDDFSRLFNGLKAFILAQAMYRQLGKTGRAYLCANTTHDGDLV